MNRKRVSKKIWILGVFSVFITAAMLFVSWLIYAVFADSYRDIKQQYYDVVSKQIVEDIENSVKNGKQIERFYGMENVLNNMLELISTDSIPINTAITDANGNVLYSSYASSSSKDTYNEMIAADNLQTNLKFDADGSSYRIVNFDEYEFIIQPIFGENEAQIGSMELFYRSDDVERELLVQKQKSDLVTWICAAATILLLAVYFLMLSRKIAEECESDSEAEILKHKSRQNLLMFIVPVIVIMAGLLVQCVISYNEYHMRYKDVMFEGATGISEYIGEIVDELNEKGVPYEKMDGLAEFLAGKVEDSPLLWNVSVVNVFADTSDILGHSNEYSVSLATGKTDALTNMHINIEISKKYIDEKMTDMLLVFVVTFVVALIMIYELLKLPDSLFSRLSKSYRKSRREQAGAVAPAIRLGAFLAYTGMYVGIPFSGVLIAQWNRSIFGLSVTFLASLPMTAELLATMLCSLFLLPVYKRLNLKFVLTVSTLISVFANMLCFFANSPEQLIVLRFVSGIGFAGIKYSLNTIVSQGAISESDTTNNLAALNAGLLGGITCGGTLGAVIAGAVSVHTSYVIAGIFIMVFLVIILGLSPWKLIAGNMSEERKNVSEEKKAGILSTVFNPSILRYMLLVALPMNFGLMFVVAFFPSFVSSLGLPDVMTSYGYLVNGLVGIYMGPKLLSVLSKKIGKTACVAAAMAMGATGVLILNIDLPMVIILVSVAVLGLFDGFGTPATSDYYVNMPAVKRLGVSQGLSVLSVVGSIVQTFSPVLYSVILSNGSIGINILGFVFAACSVLFLFTIKMTGIDKKTQNNSYNIRQ